MGGAVACLRGGGAVRFSLAGFEDGQFVVPVGALLAQVGEAVHGFCAEGGLGAGVCEAVQVVLSAGPVGGQHGQAGAYCDGAFAPGPLGGLGAGEADEVQGAAERVVWAVAVEAGVGVVDPGQGPASGGAPGGDLWRPPRWADCRVMPAAAPTSVQVASSSRSATTAWAMRASRRSRRASARRTDTRPTCPNPFPRGRRPRRRSLITCLEASLGAGSDTRAADAMDPQTRPVDGRPRRTFVPGALGRVVGSPRTRPTRDCRWPVSG